MSENQLEVAVSEDSLAIQEATVEDRFDNDEARGDLKYINEVIQDNVGEPLLNMLLAVQQDTLQSDAVKESLQADIHFLDALKNEEFIGSLEMILKVANEFDFNKTSDFIRNNYFDLARRAQSILGFIAKPE